MSAGPMYKSVVSFQVSQEALLVLAGLTRVLGEWLAVG